MSTATATVAVLTAEVRVLMVGSRQVTLSVYRQLDLIEGIGEDDPEPFGRVRTSHDDRLVCGARIRYGEVCRTTLRTVNVVGRDANGALVRSRRSASCDACYERRADDRARADAVALGSDRDDEWQDQDFAEWANLPLIVLAGLR